jgi:hypothetical protein
VSGALNQGAGLHRAISDQEAREGGRNPALFAFPTIVAGLPRAALRSPVVFGQKPKAKSLRLKT